MDSEQTLPKKRPSPIPLHPILFAIYPVVVLAGINFGEAPPGDVLRLLLGILLFVCILVAILYAVSRDWQRAAFFATIFVVFFFYINFSNYIDRAVVVGPLAVPRHWIILALWAIIFLFASLIWKRVRSQILTRYLNITAGLLLVFSSMTVYRFVSGVM